MATPRPRTPGYYQHRSEHFLSLVDSQLARGELELACKLLWGAAAHAIKSAAEQRGWQHGTHARLGMVIERLVTETGAPPHLAGQYRIASDFHVGFYGDLVFNTANIRAGKDLIAEFIRTLENLPDPQT